MNPVEIKEVAAVIRAGLPGGWDGDDSGDVACRAEAQAAISAADGPWLGRRRRMAKAICAAHGDAPGNWWQYKRQADLAMVMIRRWKAVY